MRILIVLGLMTVSAGCASVRPSTGAGRPFQYPDDTFAFANELVFNYESGVPSASTNAPARQQAYTRRCFVKAAGVVQFWKHARFDPQAAPVPQAELARRIRQVRNRAAWWPSEPPERRIVFPGFANLHDFSDREGPLLRANMGAGWTTYFHPRKYPMPFLPSPEEESRVADDLQFWMDQGHPMVIWIYNFPNVDINHAVTVYGKTQPPRPDTLAFHVYDPNFTDGPRTLLFDAVARTFSYEKTFYFPGGTVHVRPMYTSLFR